MPPTCFRSQMSVARNGAKSRPPDMPGPNPCFILPFREQVAPYQSISPNTRLDRLEIACNFPCFQGTRTP
jgi:hypothetical protein